MQPCRGRLGRDSNGRLYTQKQSGTDQPTDTVAYMSRCRRQKYDLTEKAKKGKEKLLASLLFTFPGQFSPKQSVRKPKCDH